jgi:hypothetical protein
MLQIGREALHASELDLIRSAIGDRRGQGVIKAISRHVEEQPITSLLVAFGVGMIAGPSAVALGARR